MKLASIRVKNYKALRDIEFPLSQFVCLTGENNAGKSSVLQAMSLFLSPVKLDSHHFFDPSKEMTVSIMFLDIEEADLMRLDEEPRERIRALTKNGELGLTRRFRFEGETELGYYTLLPKDKNYSKEVVDAALKGKKTKGDISKAVATLIPTRAGDLPPDLSTQKDAKALIERWGDALPANEKGLQFKPIPTGAGFSITPLLPEDIYIPAVKDLRDDINLKQGSSFGKVLGILMDRIELKLTEEAGLFEKLRAKLTRVEREGAIEDNRLQEIQEIEATIQRFVRESFASIDLELEIPPPELKTVLSTARIFVNDGTKGPIDFKGDGLRRAVFFAILRTYVELNAEKKTIEEPVEAGAVRPSKRGYILLFEEPELFLHPDAQRILFDALRVFAKDHHVIVTTHSPIFLGPGAATFVRMGKSKDKDVQKPYTIATPVDLKGMNPRDEFQLICFENNNAALFAKKVVLVEGDSEAIVFPHIALTLNPEWSCSKKSVAFVQVKGKGSIQRYRSFFKRFNVHPFVVADLDVILRDFDKLDPTDRQNKLRAKLLNLVDKALPKEAAEPSDKETKDAQKQGVLRGLWAKAKQAKREYEADKNKLTELERAIQEFFDWERRENRLMVLQNPPNEEIRNALNELINVMRESGVHILSKGAIEEYYPDGEVIKGRDKPSRAQCYRNVVTTRAEIIANCPIVQVNADGETKPELEIICEAVFRPD